MTTELPNVHPTSRYSVTETCQILGIHRNTLRRYTAEGRIKMGVRKATIRKFYLGSEIMKFWQLQL
jgi:predicted site-specific integrase-resolvase